MENNFVKGLYFDKPHENAPAFVKGKLSIQAQQLTEWLASAEKTDKGYVNIDLLESREGKYYAKVNDFKPDTSNKPVEATTSGIDIPETDLPF